MKELEELFPKEFPTNIYRVGLFPNLMYVALSLYVGDGLIVSCHYIRKILFPRSIPKLREAANKKKKGE
jgi:hypothetical protein